MALNDWPGDIGDPSKRGFAVNVLTCTTRLPQELFDPLIRAALDEQNPSSNRQFIEPCLRAYGYRAVNKALLQYLENGTEEEKLWAYAGLYWAGIGDLARDRSNPNDHRFYDLEAETHAEQSVAYHALDDIWEEKRELIRQWERQESSGWIKEVKRKLMGQV